MREIKGWHVLAVFAGAFGVIITVNLILAVQAVRTFPGLEVSNSYVASQSFEADRAAQIGLGWEVSARLEGDVLVLTFARDGSPISPTIESAVFGRATSVAQDQAPEFVFDGTAFVAPVQAGPGNWNLRIRALSADGTLFQRRIVVRSAS